MEDKPEDDVALGPTEHVQFRSGVVNALYLTSDGADIQCDVKLLLALLAAMPTTGQAATSMEAGGENYAMTFMVMLIVILMTAWATVSAMGYSPRIALMRCGMRTVYTQTSTTVKRKYQTPRMAELLEYESVVFME